MATLTPAERAVAGLALVPGRPHPLGATVRDGGVNIAVVSENATALELCLFDADGRHELARLPLLREGDVWCGFVPQARAGLVYGLRAHGPSEPGAVHGFDAARVLLDPWAREIVHGAHARLARVVDLQADAFDWQGDAPPRTPWTRTVLYEVHVKNMTATHPQVPAEQRGRYLGMASEPVVEHLQRMGITAVSLLPVHEHVDEPRLARLGLVNHWGYNTVGYFCPSPRFASRADGATARAEFRALVRQLHAAGIEVLIDVVYNHTAESDEFGPTLAWRGLDDALWYRREPTEARTYTNWTGCGNTLATQHPRVLQFVLDSMRCWVADFHVDGFRFDLAPVLGRGERDFHARAPFFQAVAQDPVLAGVKLVAEPWDLGPDGYAAGRFPRGWAEWNDAFRDAVRGYWLRRSTTRGVLAERLLGSAARFRHDGRAPWASVNYVVSHDGFTLADVVRYNERHNFANGEGNRDGHADNLSWNCGVEGASDDPDVQALRARLQRALLATLLVAQGTPMLAAGAELGHTQQGNNNPYCQDNATSWIDWARIDATLGAFVTRLLALRRTQPLLGERWYDADGSVEWRRPDGEPLSADDWHEPSSGAFVCHLRAGSGAAHAQLLVLNPDPAELEIRLPPGDWHALFDSTHTSGEAGGVWNGALCAPSRSVLWLAGAPSPVR